MSPAPLDAQLKAAIDGIRILDTHEHLEDEAKRLAAPTDFSRLFGHHGESDLVSAGMSPRDVTRLLSLDAGPAEKWRLLAPFWPLTRHTGYGRAIRRTLRDLYGVEELTAESCAAVSEAMRAANRAGVHRYLLAERAGIDLCLIHNLDGPGILYRDAGDTQITRQYLAVHHFVANSLPLEELARQSSLPVGSLRELLRVIDWAFSRYGDRVVAIANHCAYWRTLRFDDVTEGQAETLFHRGYVAQEGLSSSETKALQDFLFHTCIRRAIDYRLPVRIHTGYLEGATRFDPARLRAIDLIPLFRKYPQARFVLLQMGYPYGHEVLAIAKHFANVYVDLAGAWSLDPETTRRFVQQWIATAPVNKLFAFGGSSFVAELVYGRAQMAREGLCRALTELLADGTLTPPEAEEIARRLLHDNAWTAFRLEDKMGA